MTKKVKITLEEEGSITIETKVWSPIWNDYTESQTVVLNGKGKTHFAYVHAYQDIVITEN